MAQVWMRAVLAGVGVAMLWACGCHEEPPPPTRYPENLGSGGMRLLPTGSSAYSKDILSGTGKIVGAGGPDAATGEGQPEGSPDGAGAPEKPSPDAPGSAEASPPSAEDEAAIREVLTKLTGGARNVLEELAVQDQRPVLKQILGPFGDLEAALQKLGEGRETTAPKTAALAKTALGTLAFGFPAVAAEAVPQAPIRMTGPDKAVVEIVGQSVSFEREAEAWFVRFPSPLPSEATAVDFANAVRDLADGIGQVSAGLEGGSLADDAAAERVNAALQRFQTQVAIIRNEQPAP